MVKITKEGTLPGERSYFGSCTNCGCQFEFQAKEATLTHDQRDGDFYSIPCPTKGCGHAVTVAAYSHYSAGGLRNPPPYRIA